MFNIGKFGGYISRLRKNADMTQSELADKLNLTRQSISKYERGDSFPDISILLLISDVFGVTLDELINSGEPSQNEKMVIGNIAMGNENFVLKKIADIAEVAPLLKPSILEKILKGMDKQGIDISSIVELSEYLSDKAVVGMLESANYDGFDEKLLEKLMPFLDKKSKCSVFQRILDGEIDYRILKSLILYDDFGIGSLIEYSVVEGDLPCEALVLLRQASYEKTEKHMDDI